MAFIALQWTKVGLKSHRKGGQISSGSKPAKMAYGKPSPCFPVKRTLYSILSWHYSSMIVIRGFRQQEFTKIGFFYFAILKIWSGGLYYNTNSRENRLQDSNNDRQDFLQIRIKLFRPGKICFYGPKNCASIKKI